MPPVSSAQALAGTPVDAAGYRLLPLEVVLNGANIGGWTLLESQGQLYAPADAFDEWRISRRQSGVPIQYRNQAWYALASIPGFESRINLAEQSLAINFSAQAFAATRLTQEAEERPPVSVAIPAAFLNYDLSYNSSANRGAARVQELGSLTELGFSAPFGVLTTGMVGRNVLGSPGISPRSWRRLETTFTRDFVDNNITLRLGDTATRASMAGRSMYFGGLQLGRNFALAPGFVAQPVPVLSGTSSSPSTVELYINDALRQISSVPAGPFSIENPSGISGSGQARIVVRDVLGRETVQVQPFFTHSDLLEAGLSDWSLELGAVRRNLGTDNANYGERFASGLWRQGLSKGLTLEARGEVGQDTRRLGLGVSAALPYQMLGQASLSHSVNNPAGRGLQWALGLEHSNLRHGFTAQVEGASERYRWVGGPAAAPQKLQASASYSYSSERFGSLGIGAAWVETFGQPALNTLSLNYSVRIGSRNSLSLRATRVDSAASSGVSVGMTFVMPLDNMVNVSTSVNHRAGLSDIQISTGKGLTAETGLGWRLLGGSRSGENFAESGLYYQGGKALVTGDLSVSSGAQAVRLGAQGGLIALDGRVFAARTVQDSFALVEVPGYPNVGVGLQGSRLTSTDKDGVALLSRLQAYQANNIRLEADDLPISAELDNIEQVAVPPWRSGLKIAFPVRSGRGALIKLVLDDGEPAPPGAELRLDGSTQEFFVARRGEAFVTGLQAKNQLRLLWNQSTCTVTVELPDGALDEIARVGPLKCSGVKR